MPTRTADRAGGRLRYLSALLPILLLTPFLVACGDDPPDTPDDPDAGVAEAIQRTLRQRARAILSRDPVAFERTLARRDPGFLAEQEGYYANVAQLPLGTVRFDLAERTIERSRAGYWAEVAIRIELEGYDVAPVLTRDRWRFVPTGDERRYLLTSTTDADWEAGAGTGPQPWDLGEIEARDRAGVLGIFDPTTVLRADAVLDSVSEARYEVRSVLPPHIEDPGGVVVYVLADQEFVESIDGLPVSDPDRLDGVTVPVPRNADDADGPVSSYRIMLSPHVLDESEAVLDRLVRHELTHVALGERARGVPLWFTEGLAEYVSVQPIAPAERRLQTTALDLVAGGVTDVPADSEFGGPQAEGWYAVSWWMCEYIAATYGEPALWTLLDELGEGGDQRAVVRDQLGITTSELVEASIGLMRRTYE
ncbi:gluzincin family metallopeptidase [Nocardioides bizhenqiangii]|uniref:Peptidase MA-like domain-containing protein n=1 Tax=Nocardioides bizhenqiangii TaxID=3095076 RepID=A0ABZ0ZMC8_9ACTN|nr:hypothetical protein [Nocardioides sp. HM61]WQQ24889.1 hypothetical protein SHK19_13020 [Nocardioides sp. HM61]